MPLVDVVGRSGTAAPLHIGAIALKLGVTVATTVISIVVEDVAHWPTAGVNV
jgi:hypothetical protein